MSDDAAIAGHVGVDIGGTKTRVVREQSDGSLTDETVATDEWRRGELHDHEANIERLVGTLQRLGVRRTDFLAVGAHGLDARWQVDLITGWLRSRWIGRVLAVNDVELLGPANGFDDAIAVVVGTGSKIVAHTADGDELSAGGYGHILSDPGGAPALAREAMRAILRARDTGAAPDALGIAFMHHAGVDDEVALAYAFTGDMRITAWGAYGPLVFDAAAQGSALAAEVIDSAALALASDVDLVVRRGAVGADVVCAGGVVENRPEFVKALARHISEVQPALRVHVGRRPPVFGALRLAHTLG